MFPVSEQLSTASKANFDTQLSLITALTGKAFEGVEKLIELNLTTAKSSFEDFTATSKQLLAAKDPQEFFTLSTAHFQPSTEKALSYGRTFASIATSTQAEFTTATESQIADTNSKVLALIEEVSKNAPAGTENVVALVKTALGNANTSYDNLTKTTKQAVQTLEANLNTAANQITQATVKAVAVAKK